MEKRIIAPMDTRKDLTKELLADCFRNLLMTTPFTKITIRMITDEAGLIRPTFYKHFQDKYEILEWIFDTRIRDSVDLLLQNGMELDAILMLLRCLEKDKSFYSKAYTIDGPNSFQERLDRYLYEAFLTIATRYPIKTEDRYPILTYEVIARQYASGFLRLIEEWLDGRIDCTAEELADAYKYLLSHSALDMIS